MCGESDNTGNSSSGNVLEVGFDFDSVVILLDYPRSAERTEKLHRHH